jgi:thiamine pyrophosphate-dependent acetolactate synthase large subunit-like protein
VPASVLGVRQLSTPSVSLFQPAQAPFVSTVASVALLQVVAEVHRFVPIVAGGNNMPMIEAAYAVGLTPVPMRSEAGAGFMAGGIAWESKLPTLCFVITSVGVYGLTQALYAACVNRRPVVVISGEVSAVGCGSVQSGDGWDGPSVTQATRPFTAWSADVSCAALAIRSLRRAVLLASETRLPVHVNIPLKVQKERAP